MRRVVCTLCGMTNMGAQQECLGCGNPLPTTAPADPARTSPTPTSVHAPSDMVAAPAAASQGPVGDPPTVWQPTHRVPASGLSAYDQPDPRATPAANLVPWLEVEVVGILGAWARIVCSNGWAAWVDGRALTK